MLDATIDGAPPGQPRSLWIGAWSRVADSVAALLVLFLIVLWVEHLHALDQLTDVLSIRISLKNSLLVGLFAVLWPAALTVVGSYDPLNTATLGAVIKRLLVGCALGSGLVILIVSKSNTGLFGPWTVPMFWAGACLATLVVRLATRLGAVVGRLRSRPRRIVMAGTGARAVAVWEQLRHDPLIRYELVATVDSPDAEVASPLADRPLIPLDQLEAFCMHTVIDEVVVAMPVRSCYEQIEQVLQICQHAGVRSLYLAEAFSPTIARAQMTSSGGFSAVSLHVVHDDWRLFVKRGIDLAVAITMLLVLSPVFLMVMLAVKVTSPGPVFFAQDRYGYRKRIFKMYKFRTMVVDAERLQATLEHKNEATGPVFKIMADPRITPVGRFLRRTSLDELPQLWNVVMGEMSLVGPRPLAIRDVRRFDAPWLMRRFSVRPGLTCLWQIGGRSNLSFDEWMRLDLEYIDNWSLRLDAQILVWTVPAVLNATGAA